MTYRKWTREQDLLLLKTSTDEELLTLFPDVKLDTLKRRKRMVKSQPTVSDGTALGLSGLERVNFDTRNFKAYVIGDYQAPFHNKAATESFLRLLEDTADSIDVVINDGDHYDNYAVSSYSKDKRRGSVENWKQEIEVGNSIFADWRSVFDKDILLLKGNHEDRWDRYLNDQAPDKVREAAGEALDFDKVYGLDKYNIITFPYMQPVLFGDVVITHGTRSNTTSPGTTALKEIRQRFGTNVIVGHCHSGAMVTQRYIHGTAVGVENFTMADLDGLGYAMFPNWLNGFTYLEVRDGKSYLQPVPMHNNTFAFNGKLYTPKGIM